MAGVVAGGVNERRALLVDPHSPRWVHRIAGHLSFQHRRLGVPHPHEARALAPLRLRVSAGHRAVDAILPGLVFLLFARLLSRLLLRPRQRRQPLPDPVRQVRKAPYL